MSQPDYFKVLAPLLHMKDAVIIEVGAYDGKHTQRLYDILPSSPAFYGCFEADPRHARKVAMAVERLPNMHFMPLAVGEEMGKREFFQSQGKKPNTYMGSSSLCKPTRHKECFPDCEFLPPIEVGCTTIDSFCKTARVDHIDLLWADIQGAEPLLLEGAKKMLPFTQYLLLEVDQQPLYEGSWTKADFETFLQAFGHWEIVHEFEWDILWRNLRYEANCQHEKKGGRK
jgi:FkbM family methyltransferase